MSQMFPPIKCQCCLHIETSQLISNQLIGFSIRATLALNGLRTAEYYNIEKAPPPTNKSVYNAVESIKKI